MQQYKKQSPCVYPHSHCKFSLRHLIEQVSCSAGENHEKEAPLCSFYLSEDKKGKNVKLKSRYELRKRAPTRVMVKPHVVDLIR